MFNVPCKAVVVYNVLVVDTEVDEDVLVVLVLAVEVLEELLETDVVFNVEVVDKVVATEHEVGIEVFSDVVFTELVVLRVDVVVVVFNVTFNELELFIMEAYTGFACKNARKRIKVTNSTSTARDTPFFTLR